MPEVSLRIGPKSYVVACGEGEEEKVERLGAMIAQRYEKLGKSRAPLENYNLVFAALFMADELADLEERLQAAQQQSASHAEALEALREQNAARLTEAEAAATSARERAAAQKDELRREIEILRKAEARARDETIALKTELAELRDAQRHQHNLFGSDIDEDALAALIEALAERAESAADALELAKLEDTRDTA